MSRMGSQAFPRFDSTTQLSWRPIFVLTPGTDLKAMRYSSMTSGI